MPAWIVLQVDSEAELAAIDAAAHSQGQSREAWAMSVLLEAASTPPEAKDFAPHYALTARTNTGGELLIFWYEGLRTGAFSFATGLSEEQERAREAAKLFIDRNEPGAREQAVSTLEAAGFEVQIAES